MVLGNTIILAVEDGVTHVNPQDFWEITKPINIILGVLSICVMIAIFFFVVRKLDKKRYFNIFTGGLIFIGGLLLYLYGFYYEGTKDSLMALWMRASMSSLEMFISHSDLLEVNDGAKESPVYMTMFSIVHCVAILFSAYIAISYLGLRIFSHSRYIQYKLRLKKKPTLNVFMNFNENAYNLAKDWRKGNKEVLTVFINQEKPEQNGMSRFNLSKVIDMFSTTTKKDLIEKIDSIGGILINTKKALIDVISEDDNLLEEIGATRLETLFKNVENINIFFISDDGDYNITSTLKLCNWIENKASIKKNIKVFCEASRESMNVVLTLKYKKIDLKVVDTAYLSMLSLKKEVDTTKNNTLYPHYKFHPINFIDIDSIQGLSLTPFQSLIIGFGPTGKEALKFLYEFGQFPMRVNRNIQSGFKGWVIDKNMDILYGQFIQECPQMQSKYSNINYLDYDYNETKFWNLMEQLIDKLNYIVIADGNDESSMRLAIKISGLAQRKGRLNDRLRIFVRSYTPNKENKLQLISKDYDFIELFGRNTEIYTKNLFDIFNEERKANIFSSLYNTLYEKINNNIKDNEPTIDKHHISPNKLDLIDENRLKAQKKWRNFSQNLSNVYHIYTKIKLLGEPFNEEHKSQEEIIRQFILEIEEDNFRPLLSDSGMSKYPLAIENIAHCEHLRWVASHALLGYTPMPLDKYQDITSNEFLKTHVCMTDWGNLDTLSQGKNNLQEYKSYDRLTVFTSLKLIIDKIDSRNE